MWRLFNNTRDFYSNNTLILAVLVVIMMTQVNPKAKPIDAMKPSGQIAVLVCWPKGSTDIDTWGDAPGEEKPVGFTHPQGKVWTLLTDNRGETQGNAPANCESMFARDTPAGEYTINVFGFAVDDPVSVNIVIGFSAGDGGMSSLPGADMVIKNRQERTVIRFMVDDKGQIVPGSINQVFKPLYIGG